MASLASTGQAARAIIAKGVCPNQRCYRGGLVINDIPLECPLFGRPVCSLHGAMVKAGKKALMEYLQDRGVPPLHLAAMGNLKSSKGRDAASAWSLEGNFSLSGGVGVGKSFAAALAVCRWGGSRLERRITTPGVNPDEEARVVSTMCFWQRSSALVSVGDTADAVRVTARKVPLLVIDDLGMESMSKGEWSLAVLSDLVAERYDHQRQTIITTNMGGVAEMAGRYGARVVDRLMANGVFVRCDGPSMRGL